KGQNAGKVSVTASCIHLQASGCRENFLQTRAKPVISRNPSLGSDIRGSHASYIGLGGFYARFAISFQHHVYSVGTAFALPSYQVAPGWVQLGISRSKLMYMGIGELMTKSREKMAKGSFVYVGIKLLGLISRNRIIA
ncbi:MAG: hypothetical protein FWG02_11160, partial [Holophagaceae bacterium]|nr:hypothetical protein [Holophagaceae bacterium]